MEQVYAQSLLFNLEFAQAKVDALEVLGIINNPFSTPQQVANNELSAAKEAVPRTKLENQTHDLVPLAAACLRTNLIKFREVLDAGGGPSDLLNLAQLDLIAAATVAHDQHLITDTLLTKLVKAVSKTSYNNKQKSIAFQAVSATHGVITSADNRVRLATN